MLLVPVQESASGMCACILMRCVVFVDGTAPSDSIKNIKNVEWNGRETKLLIHHNSGCAREIITYREDYPSETIPSEPASAEWRPNPMLFVLKIEINYIYLRQCRLENFSILHDLFITARLGCEKRPAREKFAGRVKETGIWHWHAKGSSGDAVDRHYICQASIKDFLSSAFRIANNCRSHSGLDLPMNH